MCPAYFQFLLSDWLTTMRCMNEGQFTGMSLQAPLECNIILNFRVNTACFSNILRVTSDYETFFRNTAMDLKLHLSLQIITTPFERKCPEAYNKPSKNHKLLWDNSYFFKLYPNALCLKHFWKSFHNLCFKCIILVKFIKAGLCLYAKLIPFLSVKSMARINTP